MCMVHRRPSHLIVSFVVELTRPKAEAKPEAPGSEIQPADPAASADVAPADGAGGEEENLCAKLVLVELAGAEKPQKEGAKPQTEGERWTSLGALQCCCLC